MTTENIKLVNAEKCIELIFEEPRPSIRWFWTHVERKTIPAIQVGRLIFFNVEDVKAALLKHSTIKNDY